MTIDQLLITFLRVSDVSPSSVVPQPTVTPVRPANSVDGWFHGRHTGETLSNKIHTLRDSKICKINSYIRILCKNARYD